MVPGNKIVWFIGLFLVFSIFLSIIIRLTRSSTPPPTSLNNSQSHARGSFTPFSSERLGNPEATNINQTNFDLLSTKFDKLQETVQGLEKSVLALQLTIDQVDSTVANFTQTVQQEQKLNISEPHFLDFNEGCGGVVKANNGCVNYTRLRADDDMEECIWTILTENTILEFTADLSGHTHSHMTVLNVNTTDGKLAFVGILRKQTIRIASGVAIIVFTSATKDAQFLLNFRSYGAGSSDRYVFAAMHSMSSSDESHYQNMEKSASAGAYYFHIFTQGSTRPNMVFDVKVLLQAEKSDLEKCDEYAFTAYELVHGYHLRQLVYSKCPTFYSSEFSSFKSTTGSFIGIYRSMTPNPKSIIRWTAMEQDRSKSTSCGGSVYGDSGYISYKRDRNYENNEFCYWNVFSRTHKAIIKFTLVENGLQECCDKVGIETKPERFTDLTDKDPYLALEVAEAGVRFKSNNKVTGTGFLLKYTTTYSGH